MTVYPSSIKAPNGIQQKNIKPTQRDVSAAGYVMARSKATLLKKEFLIKYNNMTTAERDTLEAFFDANQGLEFDWTHPEQGGDTYQVVFNQDEIEFSWIAYQLWSTSFKIREV